MTPDDIDDFDGIGESDYPIADAEPVNRTVNAGRITADGDLGV